MPVDDRDLPHAFFLQVAQAFFGHFAGADHQCFLVVESLEDLPGEVGHGHAGNAHAPLVDGRFAGHAPRHPQRRLKQRVHQRPRVVLLGGHLVGLLHLGQDLRLAEDHAVETRGHGKQVLHGRLVAVLIETFDHLGRIEAVEAGQELGDLIERRLGLALRGGVDFHPIAGRQQHGLDARKHPPPMVQRLAGLLGREGQPLPVGERRAVMAAPDDLH